MGRRKGEDTAARKRRRMPHVAVIDRSEPFRDADRRILEEQCFRITNGQEFHYGMSRQDDRDVYVVHFAEAHQAQALSDWLRREHFAERPAPKFGPSCEEKHAFEQAALHWGLRTGALRRVVQAYRRAMFDNASKLRCRSAAQEELRRHLPPRSRQLRHGAGDGQLGDARTLALVQQGAHLGRQSLSATGLVSVRRCLRAQRGVKITPSPKAFPLRSGALSGRPSSPPSHDAPHRRQSAQIQLAPLSTARCQAGLQRLGTACGPDGRKHYA